MDKLSHIDNNGKIRMVDISDKSETFRFATASVKVILNEKSYGIVKENRAEKGDVLTAAKLAGISAAKKTWDLIPLCHPIRLTHIGIEYSFDDGLKQITIISSIKSQGPTGVEMEALIACSVTALTVYDMLKAVQRDISITDLMLIEKKGGKSGEFRR